MLLLLTVKDTEIVEPSEVEYSILLGVPSDEITAVIAKLEAIKFGSDDLKLINNTK